MCTSDVMRVGKHEYTATATGMASAQYRAGVHRVNHSLRIDPRRLLTCAHCLQYFFPLAMQPLQQTGPRMVIVLLRVSDGDVLFLHSICGERIKHSRAVGATGSGPSRPTRTPFHTHLRDVEDIKAALTGSRQSAYVAAALRDTALSECVPVGGKCTSTGTDREYAMDVMLRAVVEKSEGRSTLLSAWLAHKQCSPCVFAICELAAHTETVVAVERVVHSAMAAANDGARVFASVFDHTHCLGNGAIVPDVHGYTVRLSLSLASIENTLNQPSVLRAYLELTQTHASRRTLALSTATQTSSRVSHQQLPGDPPTVREWVEHAQCVARTAVAKEPACAHCKQGHGGCHPLALRVRSDLPVTCRVLGLLAFSYDAGGGGSLTIYEGIYPRTTVPLCHATLCMQRAA